jgi:hypothetical protein
MHSRVPGAVDAVCDAAHSFGGPIGRKQGVAFQIADLDVMAAAAHQLVYARRRCVIMVSAPGIQSGAAIAKLYATESAVSATRIATQVFGGYGFMEEYPIARFYRTQRSGDRGRHLGGAAAADRPPAGSSGGVVDHGQHQCCAGPNPLAHRTSERPSSGLRTSSSYAIGSPAVRRFDFREDGQLANAMAEDLPADGVVTGRGLVHGRAALVVANDPSVKAGSWGARTVEKIIRMTEVALRDELPIFWFIDSAGARITDQVDLFPAEGAQVGSSETR